MGRATLSVVTRVLQTISLFAILSCQLHKHHCSGCDTVIDFNKNAMEIWRNLRVTNSLAIAAQASSKALVYEHSE